MTKEEIIEMARQAGFVDYELDDGTTNSFDKRYEAFAKLVVEKAIKETLAHPDQEPVAIRYDFDGYGYQYIDSGTGSDWQTRVQGEPLYTAPHPEQYPQIAISPEIVGYVAPQRTWVGLSDEERQEIALEVPIDAVLITEATLKDKNNG